MIIFKKAIPRRAFLRGAGVSIALPFLDAMIPAFAASGSGNRPPLRLGNVYLPTGRVMENWLPKTEGTGFEITPSLQPVAAFRDKMLVLSGLDLKASDLLPGERGGPHARPCASYLTGVHPFGDRVGISVDQVLAKHLGTDTPLASLEMNLDQPGFAGQADGDYSGYYASTVSWLTPTTPLPAENNPRNVFERLFGDTDTLDPEAMKRRIQNKGSVLDYVGSRVNKLLASVNSSDRYKMEEYLNAVRDIERGIQAAESRTASDDEAASLKGTKRPAGIPGDYAEHARIMFDMMVLAYQANMTRVVTFMLGHEGTNRNYTELGALDGHHSLSHHKGAATAIELLKKIDYYQSEQLAYFLNKMESIKEVDGSSLLDNSIIIAGGSLSDANNHVHNDVPITVFGSAQGRLKLGRHIRYKGEPLSNLHLAVLDMFGAPSEEFLSNDTSDATGILKGIT
jgi:hypothetical protein